MPTLGKARARRKTKMMTPKELLDTILGYLGFVVQIEESQNEAGNLVLQIYTEESRRLIGRDGKRSKRSSFCSTGFCRRKTRTRRKLWLIARCIAHA